MPRSTNATQHKRARALVIVLIATGSLLCLFTAVNTRQEPPYDTSVARTYVSRKLLPPDGVYAVRVQLPEGEFGGMLNLGPRPTVGDDRRRVETHVFDASRDWYGAHVRLDFVRYLRGTRPFAGLEALKAQLAEDERDARAALAHGVGDWLPHTAAPL